MGSEDIRVYDEVVDDAEAAALGRARMADGRRIELSMEDLGQLLGDGDQDPMRAGRHGQTDMY